MWRRPAELYREDSFAEEERPRRKVKKITRSPIVEATSEERRGEETLPTLCRVHQHPLIKSLLNRVTTLPLARRVAVIPNLDLEVVPSLMFTDTPWAYKRTASLSLAFDFFHVEGKIPSVIS